MAEQLVWQSGPCWLSKKGTAESEIKVDQNTGEVDMSNWQRKHRDGGEMIRGLITLRLSP